MDTRIYATSISSEPYRPDNAENPYLDYRGRRPADRHGTTLRSILLILLSLAIAAMAMAMLLSPNALFSPIVSDEPSPEGAAIVEACREVPSPGENLCAQWVSEVYDQALGIYPWGNARDMYEQLASQPQEELEPGMALAVPTHPHTDAGRQYGHIGIYVGNDQVMDNVGVIRTTDLTWWVSHYGATSPVKYGWLSA